MSGTSMSKKNTTRVSRDLRYFLTLRFLSSQWRFVIGAFLVSKLIIITLSFITIAGFEVPYQQLRNNTDTTQGSSSKDIDSFNLKTMWFNWDSYIYHGIASETSYFTPLTAEEWSIMHDDSLGKSSVVANRSLQRFAFAPMYPILIKAVSKVIGGHYSLAALIVANIALLGALYYLYSLALLVFHKNSMAKLSVIFMLLLPTSFLLHAALSESVFLFFLVSSVYYGFKQRWILSGLLGAGVALSRSSGIILPLILLIIMVSSYGIPRSKDVVIKYLKSLPWLVLPWVAWGGFMLYCHVMTGDLFAYSRIQYIGWGVEATSPLFPIVDELFNQRFSINTIKIYLILSILALFLVHIRKIPLSLSVLGLSLLSLALTLGDRWPPSILRYIATLFPLALIFTLIYSNKRIPGVKLWLIPVLAGLQAVMLVFWILSWTKLII